MKYKNYNKNHKCPVCHKHSGCKLDTTTNRILCRGGSTTNPEYKLIKSTGQWGIYVHESEYVDYKGNKDKYEEARKRWQEQQAKNRERDRIELNLSPSRQERDRDIKRLLPALHLTTKHQQVLGDRDLSPEDIALGNFRSLRKYQHLDTKYNIPGIRGDKYLCESGILCPITDALGNFVGYQIKTDDPAKLGKYVWTTHKLEGYSITAKLKEFNEYPMTVVKGEHKDYIGICEGILKPYIASKKHGITMIGYAGGMFSPKYLLAQLRVLNPKKKIPMVIFPDAGTVSNKGWVYELNKQYIDLLVKEKYEVRVADWGHWLTDSHHKQDIDDLNSLANMKLHTVDVFEDCRINNGLYVNLRDPAITNKFSFQLIPNYIQSLITAPQIESLQPNKLLETPVESSFEPVPNTGLPVSNGKGGYFDFDDGFSSSEIYRQAIDKEYEYVLDMSGTGAGKTHAVTDLDLQDKEKLLYATTQPRNPNNEKLERDFTELPTRNPGYVFSDSKVTPSGKAVREEFKKGGDREFPTIKSNCYVADHFRAIASSNIDFNPCSLCPRQTKCITEVGNGYGFKKQIGKALKHQKIIAHPQGFSDDMFRNGSILIVDEYQQSIPENKTVTVDIGDIRDIKSRVMELHWSEAINHDLFNTLKIILNNISNVVTSTDTGKWGLTTTEVLPLFQTIDHEILLQAKDLIDEVNYKYNQDVFLSNKSLDKKTLEMFYCKDWLYLLVNILTGDISNSSLHLGSNKLTITVKNDRVINNLTSDRFKTKIFQDATGSRDHLALLLGIDPEKILVIRKKSKINDNFNVHHVTGLGRLSNNRKEGLMNKVDLIRNIISDRYDGNVGFIEYKKYAKKGDLYHHGDARGSNLFSRKKAVVSIGVPCPNLTALRMQYEVLKGVRVTMNDKGFQKFVNAKIVSEIIQEIGRIRANRRLDEELHYYFIGDVNINFLAELGYNLVTESAITMDNKLGNRQQQLRYDVITALKDLLEAGETMATVTQQKIADEIDRARTSIANMARAFGGWEATKRMLAALIYDKRDDFDDDFGEFTDTDMYLANNYLPELFSLDFAEMCSEAQQVIVAYGEKKFRQLIADAPAEAIANFLLSIYNELPTHYRRNLMSACRNLTG